MPKNQTPSIAVTGDGRRTHTSLSGPRKQGSKPVMDHTRRGDLVRTNIKALARILKQSEGRSEGAMK